MPPSWDVIVCGAGMTGALVADRLIDAGHSVLLLEAGARPARGASVPEPDRRAWSHQATRLSYDCTRVRAVGGRAHVWGGWCSRLPPIAARRAGLPFSVRDLAGRYAEIERTLGVVEGVLDARYAAIARELELRIGPKRGALRGAAPWTPLALAAARRARAHQVALGVDGSARHADVMRTLDLRTERVRSLRAKAFVLAASPLETTRLLLSSALGSAHPAIGHGLVDHMVASYVLLEPRPPSAPAARGPFPGAALVEGFVNIDEASQRPYPGGFTIELTGPLHLEALGVERMVPSDELERWSATAIHALGELCAQPRRKVDLAPNARDVYGRRLPRVHFAWSRSERILARDLALACTRLADTLAIPGSRLVRLNDPLQPGAGHEAGTCAAGRDSSFPCDPWGALRGTDNVWVADASVMRTATDRHPTLTLLAHALRVSEAVTRYLD